MPPLNFFARDGFKLNLTCALHLPQWTAASGKLVSDMFDAAKDPFNNNADQDG